MKLLIADIDPLILRNLKFSLAYESDIEVVGLVADSADAVDMCKKVKPNVVLLDYRLDGATTARQIKDTCPNVCIIILTLYGSAHEVRQFANIVVDGYIAKADGISNIIESIRSFKVSVR